MEAGIQGARVEEVVRAEVEAALVTLEAARGEPYYDDAADQSARERYYQELSALDGEPLRAALTALLDRTHSPRPRYKPMQWVYPRVDLHPDGLLRSIYSGKGLTPEELIEADAEIERARTERLFEFPGSEGDDPMATQKQRQAARRNVKKAQAGARKKKTITKLSSRTPSALGREGAKAAARKRGASKGAGSGAGAMTVTELRREAARLGIEGRSKMGKAQLIRAVGQKRRSHS